MLDAKNLALAEPKMTNSSTAKYLHKIAADVTGKNVRIPEVKRHLLWRHQPCGCVGIHPSIAEGKAQQLMIRHSLPQPKQQDCLRPAVCPVEGQAYKSELELADE